ncbi:MAG TPA: DUF1579 domain-containing protein [Pseudonocardia sp.]|uniref:DUF1579 domain-containing protein n=1 Tax=Pseudonocardia sp. TaxID=60912 RepID=UPI002B4AB2D3|nr:DUF1579 domain-containing protein [Pseudonocardia sp.]HLU56466.1 DUF1579 domain-containing protein [Pseudonocardia sp.]
MSLDGLGFLVGELTGREEVSATPWAEGGPATARATGEWALDGGLLVQHHVQERDGAAVFGTLNVFTTDPATGDVLLYAFDSVGYPPEPAARGTWHGEEQVLERTTERGSARTRFTPTPDGYRWSKEFRAPGSDVWSPVVAGELRHA